MITFRILSSYHSETPGDAALAFDYTWEAQEKFDELKKTGHTAFKVVPGGKDTKEVKQKVDKIEPDTDYLITPRIGGG